AAGFAVAGGTILAIFLLLAFAGSDPVRPTKAPGSPPASPNAPSDPDPMEPEETGSTAQITPDSPGTSTYDLVIQEGQPIPEAGIKAYGGTRDGVMYCHPMSRGSENVHQDLPKGCLQVNGGWGALVGFALTAKEGGPL